MKKIILVFLISLLSVVSAFAFDDAKGSSMAGSLSASAEGAIANWYNPARLSADDKNDIVISYQNPYNAANLTAMKFGYKQSLSFISFGLYYDSIQAGNVYGNTKIGLNLSKKFDAIIKRTSLLVGVGAILRDNYINSSSLQTHRYIYPDAGVDILYQATTKLQINLATDFQYDTQTQTMTLVPAIGVKVRKFGLINIGANVFEKKYSAGIESKVFYNFFVLRAGGAMTQPSKMLSFSLNGGFGLKFDNFGLDLAYVFNQTLGGYGIVSVQFIL